MGTDQALELISRRDIQGMISASSYQMMETDPIKKVRDHCVHTCGELSHCRLHEALPKSMGFFDPNS